jgi:AspT/YidE/YbjL antiporter-like protein
LGADENFALNQLVGRTYRVEKSDLANVAALQRDGELPVTVEKVKRGNIFVQISPELKLQTGDLVLLVGNRDSVVALEEHIGPEVADHPEMDVIMKTQEVVVNHKDLAHTSFNDLAETMKGQIRHGVYVLSVLRGGRELTISGEDNLHDGDVLKLYGSEEDVKKAVKAIGAPLLPSVKTDLVLTGLGIILGLLIGTLSLKIGGIPLTLGSGGGVLLSGLLFGWFKSKRPQIGGTLPSPASELLKDFGLAGFVAVVGINSGLRAITTIKTSGLSIFVGGLFVTLVPLFFTMLIGRYLLGYKNAAVFAGALTGARSANPAFGQILSLSGNSVPTVPFAVTYALANVFLTLLGPIIVAIV